MDCLTEIGTQLKNGISPMLETKTNRTSDISPFLVEIKTKKKIRWPTNRQIGPKASKVEI